MLFYWLFIILKDFYYIIIVLEVHCDIYKSAYNMS
jgi:hypothetical protein